MSYAPAYPQPGYPGQAAHHAPQPQHHQSSFGGPGGPPQMPPHSSPAPPSSGPSSGTTTGQVEGAQFRIDHRDTNSVLYLRLQPQYQIKAKPGSMVAMDASVQIKGKLKVSFKKMFTGGEVRPSSLSVPCSFPFPFTYSLFVSLRGFCVRDGRTRADAGGR